MRLQTTANATTTTTTAANTAASTNNNSSPVANAVANASHDEWGLRSY